MSPGKSLLWSENSILLSMALLFFKRKLIICSNQQKDWMGEISELYSDLEKKKTCWLVAYGYPAGGSVANSRAMIPWIPHLLYHTSCPYLHCNMLFHFICLPREGANSICTRALVNESIVLK